MWPTRIQNLKSLAVAVAEILHTHLFNGPFSGTTRVSRYQKCKTNLDFTEARDSQWQWHQLGRMQVCTSLQTDNHASIPPLSFYRLDALPAAQPTASKHWRQSIEALKALWRYYMGWKILKGHLTLTMPLSEKIFHRQGGTCYGKSMYQVWSL